MKSLLYGLFLVLAGVGMAAFVGSGDGEWSPVGQHHRDVRSASEIDGQSSMKEMLHPDKDYVAVGGQILLRCFAEPPNCSYKGFLYKVVDSTLSEVLSSGPGPNQALSYGTDCTNIEGSNFFHTWFVMTATKDSSGTYGCSVHQVGEQRPSTITHNRTSRAVKAIVHVCSEPHLKLNVTRPDGARTIVTAEDECDFIGELTWHVNGQPVRHGSGVENVRIVEGDNSLEIHEKDGCDQNATESLCNVTAEFKYIVAGRVEVFRRAKEFNGCCVDISSTAAPTEKPVTTRPKQTGTTVTYRTHPPLPTQSPIRSSHENQAAKFSAVVLGLCAVALGAAACYYRLRWKKLLRSTVETAGEVTAL